MQCMAQEGSEASVASSPPPPPPPSSSTWWPDMHPYSSWPPAAARWPPLPPSAAPYAHHHHPTSSPGAADDNLSASNATMATSFTNTSTNHSGLSMDSPGPAAAAAAAAESHLWNHVLLGTGGEVGRSMHVHDTRDDSENFLELLNSKTLAPELFAEPPACDYLKKMDSSNHSSGSTTWDHFAAAPSSLNSLDKQHLSNSSFTNALLQPAAPEPRLTNLSDLLGNWSIAPPDPCLDHCHRVSPCDGAVIGHAKASFLETSNISPVKHEMEHAANPCHGVMLEAGSCTNQEFMASNSSFARPIGHGYSSMLGLSNKLYGGGGVMDVPWAGNAPPRNLSDLISFSGSLSKPAAVKSTAARSPDTFDYKKQGQEISSLVKTSSKGSAPTSDGKKRRSEEQAGSEGSAKKFKHETSPTSSLKTQVPKVKLGDKITALQQIVSPFGKTDTASVLYEAIHYIKFLHEQVQLLSDPYMKSSSSKDYNAWGGLERKEKVDEAEVDLKSRGLCLVPVSCTPQVYRDNSVPDYWAPPYRSCLYR